MCATAVVKVALLLLTLDGGQGHVSLDDLAARVENLERCCGMRCCVRQGCQDVGTNSQDMDTLEVHPSSCVAVGQYDRSNSVHTLTVNRRRITVFCDQQTAGGGWTVIQRRRDGSVDFYRGWDEYVNGFGDLTGEFWLGLEKIHQLTSAQPQMLRVNLEMFNGTRGYALYSNFSISGPDDFYRLHVAGFSSVNGVRDGLGGHNSYQFSTKDADHDAYTGSCAVMYHGAWWYNKCHASNLNGLYKQADQDPSDAKGIRWMWLESGYNSLKAVDMMIKPYL